MYKGATIRLTDDFFTETQKAQRDWPEIFQAMKSKDLQQRLLYPSALLFKMEHEERGKMVAR